jgi:hypothetical protein
MTKGKPRACAVISETTCEPPTSSAPPATAAAISAPERNFWMSTFSPAFLKSPALCAYSSDVP